MEMAQIINQENNPANVKVVDSKNRNVMIANAFGITVGAGATINSVINQVDISGYVFNYLVIRSDKSHNFTASLWYRHNPEGSLSSPNGVIEVISGEMIRGASDWVEVKGNKINVQIQNKSDEDRQYDVYLYGVR